MHTDSTTDLTQAQLFIDDQWIEYHARVARRFHAARKHPEPVLKPDRPWEGHCPVMYGTVLKRGDRIQMWYISSPPARPVQVCYAESADGLHWEKPSLGLFEYGGSRDNNICLAPAIHPYIDDCSVIDDPQDADWPLKMLFWEGGASEAGDSGIHAARSKDGVRWEILPGIVLPFGDRFNAMPHRDQGKFVVLGRTKETYTESKGKYEQDRLAFRTESDDLVHWSEPVLVHRPDLQDPPPMRIYSATAFRHEGRLLGFLERMHVAPDVLDPELTWSDDGVQWHRSAERPAFIARGPAGTWDGGWVAMNSGPPIGHRNQLWFYYSGRSGCHGTPYPVIGAIGLATLRRDGFASIDAEEEPGFIQTPVLTWPGGDLVANVDNRRLEDSHPRHWAGWVAAEVRDPSGAVRPGFASADCVPIARNTERDGVDGVLPLQWKGGASADQFRGRPIRLRFILKDARLYSFRAGPRMP